MGSSSLAREKSYVILVGLEHSLAENISRNFNLEAPRFLNIEEQSKALQRLREDQVDPNVELVDLSTEDFLPYLDIGDLVNILNRHAAEAKNIISKHISDADLPPIAVPVNG